MTSAATYEPKGPAIVLSHGGQEFPEPGPGELEALTAAADKLGYTLERKNTREALFYYVQSILEEFPNIKSLLEEMELDGDWELNRELQYLEPKRKWTLEEITTFYEELPAFFDELLEREQIHGLLDLSFEDSERELSTIKLELTETAVTWTEEDPQKPITEAQLRAHYRSLPEGREPT